MTGLQQVKAIWTWTWPCVWRRSQAKIFRSRKTKVEAKYFGDLLLAGDRNFVACALDERKIFL